VTAIHDKILGAEILIIAAPMRLGRPSSIAQRVLERLDAMLSERADEGRPVAYNRVAERWSPATRTAPTT
jgi:multimeric flavodoxin WrbA